MTGCDELGQWISLWHILYIIKVFPKRYRCTYVKCVVVPQTGGRFRTWATWWRRPTPSWAPCRRSFRSWTPRSSSRRARQARPLSHHHSQTTSVSHSFSVLRYWYDKYTRESINKHWELWEWYELASVKKKTPRSKKKSFIFSSVLF